MKRWISLMLAAVLMISGGVACAEGKETEEQAPVFLYCVQDMDRLDRKVGVFCMDEAGIFWGTEEADLEENYTEGDLLQLLKERRGLTRLEKLLYRQYDGSLITAAWLKEQAGRSAAIPAEEGTPKKTGAYVDETAVYALRNKADGSMESVLLGMSGRRLFENTDPDAQYLYGMMWMFLMEHISIFHPAYGLATEGVSPHGFRTVTVREFFGLELADAGTAVVTAAETDCEEGLKDRPLSDEEREWALALAERGIITRKKNAMSVTGGTTVFFFHTANGEYLGRIETYPVQKDALAVGRDGMYSMSILPESTGELPAEEQRLLTVRIDGNDYMLGKTTPRDIIRDGWKCTQTRYGSFRMESGKQSFYVHTAGDSPDEPVYSVNPSSTHEYCGFDGFMDPENPEDPDTVWREKARKAAGKDAATGGSDEDNDYNPPFEGLYYWLKTAGIGEVEESTFEEEDDIHVYVGLSDGRRLKIISRRWFPVHLTLLDPDETEKDGEV